MKMERLYTKIADQEWEFDEICRLNHQTFSEEIQQHDKTPTGLLIDKFHSENQYIICLNESEIVGMVALRDKRPFSLDFKLENIDHYLPPHKLSCEIRLLIVKPAFRNSCNLSDPTIMYTRLFNKPLSLNCWNVCHRLKSLTTVAS